MAASTRIELLAPEQIVGSTPYTVSTAIANTADVELTGVVVEPVSYAGRLLGAEVELRDAEEGELEARRRSLIEEMELHVARAYERQRVRNLSVGEALLYSFASSLDAYASLFSIIAGRRYGGSTPAWTREAFRIHDWDDVETLEKEIIGLEKEDSRLRRAFLIDKDKLARCLRSLETKAAAPVPFQVGATLSPGASIAFPFQARAPHLLRGRSVDLQFRVSYRDASTNRLTSESITRRVSVAPSAFAVPTGSMLGAACGYAIKIALQSTPGARAPIDWPTLGGSVLLGLVVALLTSRRPGTYKVITVEDFLGGFIIGALTGMFSDGVVERLRVFMVGLSGREDR